MNAYNVRRQLKELQAANPNKRSLELIVAYLQDQKNLVHLDEWLQKRYDEEEALRG